MKLPYAAFAAFLIAFLTLGASCTKTTSGGLMLVFATDGTLDPDDLKVDIRASDGKTVDLDFPISSPVGFFPTTLAIASNGDPTESVSITANVWKSGVPLAIEQRVVRNIPTDHVGEVDILLSARCTPLVSYFDGVAISLCAMPDNTVVLNATCDPATATCVSDVVDGPMLPIFDGIDAGALSGGGLGNDGGDATVASDAQADSGSAAQTPSDGTSPAPPFPSGPSAGCGKPPVAATTTAFTSHDISIPTCGTGPTTPDCIAAAFAPGGVAAEASKNGEDFTQRDYSIELPANYNPSTPYPVVFGGGGCGGKPPQMGAGFGIGETGAIQVGLSYVSSCFACALDSPPAATSCVDDPELPYFRAVLAEVESKYCVDVGNVFVDGFGSGGWNAFTLGCGGADRIRGIVSVSGGWREHEPPCIGPIAALMVVGESDSEDPIGPLATINTYNDSYGSAPGRDEILARNGCVGTSTVPYDANYPECVQYTGCPAAYPVVWCALPGQSANSVMYQGVRYAPGSVTGDPLPWRFLSTLPVVSSCPSGEGHNGNGTCAPCPSGETSCGSICVDEQTNVDHCGACSAVCPAGGACQAGACVCTGGKVVCGGACVDERTDTANCGACAQACALGASCQGGACACPSGEVVCGGTCVDETTDPSHCGGCNVACTTSELCQNGTCAPCPGGQMACYDSGTGVCVDAQTDPSNCGACGTQCFSAAPTCQAGSCACLSGTVCSGVCVDEQTDPSNCGMCDLACSPAADGGTPSCSGGVCAR